MTIKAQTDSEQSDTCRDEGPENVRCCVTCGAVLTRGTTRMHNEWHDRLEGRVSRAAMGFPTMFGSQERV